MTTSICVACGADTRDVPLRKTDKHRPAQGKQRLASNPSERQRGGEDRWKEFQELCVRAAIFVISPYVFAGVGVLFFGPGGWKAGAVFGAVIGILFGAIPYQLEGFLDWLNEEAPPEGSSNAEATDVYPNGRCDQTDVGNAVDLPRQDHLEEIVIRECWNCRTRCAITDAPSGIPVGRPIYDVGDGTSRVVGRSISAGTFDGINAVVDDGSHVHDLSLRVVDEELSLEPARMNQKPQIRQWRCGTCKRLQN